MTATMNNKNKMKNCMAAYSHGNTLINVHHKCLPQIKGNDANILFDKLEYWSWKMGGVFHKFIMPPEGKNTNYKPGDSWAEELLMTYSELRRALRQFTVYHDSKKDFDNSENPFLDADGEEKYYARYRDRYNHLTYFVRNNQLVDLHLDWLQKTLGKNGGPPSKSEAGSSVEIDTSNREYNSTPRTENTTSTLDTRTIRSTKRESTKKESLSQNQNRPLEVTANNMADVENGSVSAPQNSFKKEKSEENYIAYEPEHLKQAESESHLAAIEQRFRQPEPPKWSTGERIDGRFKVKPEFEKWLRDKGYFKPEATAVMIRNTLNKQLDSYVEEFEKFEQEQQPKQDEPYDKGYLKELGEQFWRWLHIPYCLGVRLKVDYKNDCFRLTADKQFPRLMKAIGLKENMTLDDAIAKFPTMEDIKQAFRDKFRYEDVVEEMQDKLNEEWFNRTRSHINIKQRVMTGDLA